MNSCENNFSKETTQELKNVISCQEDVICKLKKKLKTFDEIIIEKDKLQMLVNEFTIWRENNDINRKKVFEELLLSFKDQSEKLKKAICADTDRQAKYNKLQNAHDAISDELKIVKCNKNNLECRLEDSEKNIKCLQKELRYTKSELDETCCIVEKLKTNLNYFEKECCEKRKKLDDLAQDYIQLKEANGALEMDLKYTKEKLQNAKLCASRTEEKWNLERDTLSNELKTKCKNFHDLEIQYNEAYNTINENKCKIKTLATTIKDIKEASLKKYEEMKYLIQKLQEEYSTKEMNLCNLRNINNQLKQENKLNIKVINSQKNKLNEQECQLNKFKLLSKTIEQMKQKSFKTPCNLEKSSTNNCSINPMESEIDACCSSSKLMQSITKKYMPESYAGNCNKNDTNNVQFELDSLKNDMNQMYKVYDS